MEQTTMNNTYLVIKTVEDGILRPMIGIWRDDEKLKYHQPDIDKMIKNGKGDWVVVRCTLTEIQ